MGASSVVNGRGHLIPLLASAGILLAGNGLRVTLVAVRANLEGFPVTLVGLLGTVYYVGTIFGCLFTAGLIKRSGHIRVFAALAALAAVCTLSLVLAVDIWVWVAARMITGFCFSGLSMVIESWLNAKAANTERGRVFSLYRLVDLTAVTGAQFLLPAFGAGGFSIFGIVAILFCLALIPVSLSAQSSPTPPESARLRLRYVWAISPVGCIGCLTIGFTNGAFRTVGPVFAQNVGLAVDQVALFVSAGIVGGRQDQHPPPIPTGSSPGRSASGSLRSRSTRCRSPMPTTTPSRKTTSSFPAASFSPSASARRSAPSSACLLYTSPSPRD